MVLDYNVTMENHLHDHHSLDRFCSRCGAALAIKEVKTGEPKRPTCVRCGHVVYLDPKNGGPKKATGGDHFEKKRQGGSS